MLMISSFLFVPEAIRSHILQCHRKRTGDFQMVMIMRYGYIFLQKKSFIKKIDSLFQTKP